MIEITDTALQTAAAEGIDAFLRAFTDKYREALGGDPTAETISRLNGEQHSLLAYRIFRDEVTEGGFCPFGVNDGVAVYLDESLRRFGTVFPACGSSNSAIELTIEELERYSRCAEWVDVCKRIGQ